jgi:hypothetical protein
MEISYQRQKVLTRNGENRCADIGLGSGDIGVVSKRRVVVVIFLFQASTGAKKLLWLPDAKLHALDLSCGMKE